MRGRENRGENMIGPLGLHTRVVILYGRVAITSLQELPNSCEKKNEKKVEVGKERTWGRIWIPSLVTNSESLAGAWGLLRGGIVQLRCR